MYSTIIFGGYGFIGSHLYKKIQDKTIRFTQSNKIKYNFNFFSKIIKKYQPKNIFFLSGISYPGKTENNFHLDLKKNNIIIQNLLEAAKKNNYKGKIIYASSIAVYGSNNKEKVKEDDNLNPESYYALSKIIAEEQCLFYIKKYKLNIIILRLSSVFGPNLKRQVVYDIIMKILKNKNKTLFLKGSDKDKRELMYVEDLIKILIQIKNKKINSGIYNVGTGKQIFIENIIKYLKKKFNYKNKIIYLNNKSPKFSILNSTKLKKQINFNIKNNFYKNLDKTIEYIKKEIN